MADDLDPRLPDDQLASALLRHAGALALRMRTEGLAGERKTSVSDVVTAADLAAEAWLVGQLRRARPEDGILGEEGASHEGTSGRAWVIDPVDGTYNFLSGSSYWCTALALVELPPDGAPDGADGGGPDGAPDGGGPDGAPDGGGPEGGPLADAAVLLGAVYQPQEDLLWLGGHGVPATLNGKPIDTMGDASLAGISAGTYIHPGWLADPRAGAPWTAAAVLPATLRMLGSGSCDLARVAAGQLGCWFQHSCPPWDWLPGKALVRAVGGDTAVVRVNGLDWFLAGPPNAVGELALALRSGALAR
ncbi:inositol monophosphatase family protein [Pseudarthrobacter sp. P1]|uniref:inositol monophosphatase family protein n=1 Tax=Pseudarthrobacter sp. P1 TaxID=3418418 RepID=UPI003CEAA3FF